MKLLSLKRALSLAFVFSLMSASSAMLAKHEIKEAQDVAEQAQVAQEDDQIVVSRAYLKELKEVCEKMLDTCEDDEAVRAAFFGCTPNSSVEQILACLAQIKAQFDNLCSKIVRIDNILFGNECGPLVQPV